MAPRTFKDFVEKVTRKRPGVRAEMDRQQEAARVLRDALVAARQYRGLSQRALAERADWKQPYVARLESPASQLRDCRIRAVEQYMNACDLKVGFFFYEEGPNGISMVGATPVDGSPLADQCLSSVVQWSHSVAPGQSYPSERRAAS